MKRFGSYGPLRHLEGSADRRALFVSEQSPMGQRARFVLPSLNFGVASSEAATRYLF